MSTYHVGDAVEITVTITDTDGTATNPTSISLQVTDPSGNSSTPTVTNTATGAYEAAVTADEAGRWRYAWTTTGPASVEPGYFDVGTSPPTVDPLATIADLEARIGALTTAQATRAPGLLLDASALVRAYARGQTINRVTDDSVVLRPHGNEIRLPQEPVVSVTSVKAIDRDGGADVTLTDWAFDGINRIDLTGAGPTSTDTVVDWWDQIDFHTNTYRVVYTHGYETVPDVVVTVVCNMVNRVLTVPVVDGGCRPGPTSASSVNSSNRGPGPKVSPSACSIQRPPSCLIDGGSAVACRRPSMTRVAVMGIPGWLAVAHGDGGQAGNV